MSIDDSLAFPGRRGRILVSAEERRRLLIRDAVSWLLVGLIHFAFFMVLVISLQQNRDRLGRRGAIETMLDLTLPHRSDAPLFDLIRPPDIKSLDQDTSAKPLTVVPPTVTIIEPNAPASSGDVLNSIGQALACGANNFEYLNRAQQARCRHEPWQGVQLPNGTIVLDAQQRAPIPQLHMTGTEALGHQYQTNSGCPILSNMPCLQDMFSGNNSRAPAFPIPIEGLDGHRRPGHCSPMDQKPPPDLDTASLTVRLGAIAANYRTMRLLAGPAAVAAVVKADGYGLGAGRIAPQLAATGCDSFFVARLEEGVALRAVVPRARIFVLDGAAPDAVPALISHALIPVLNSLGDIAGWAAAAQTQRRRGALDAAIHIDTGMNRLGLTGNELAVLAAEWKTRLAGLNLVLLMSHLACADDLGPDAAMNRRQLDRFRTALAMLPPAPASLAASSGVFLGADYHFDLVRPGIALYGVGPKARENPMKSVAILASRVLQVRRIDKGDSVGYAATFRAKRPTMLATVALGYADGIMRAASNKGVGVIDGARAPFAGRVSMDLLSLDVTGLPKPPRIGDGVELIGDHVSLAEVAEYSGTNEYEILTGISPRVPRRYTDAGG